MEGGCELPHPAFMPACKRLILCSTNHSITGPESSIGLETTLTDNSSKDLFAIDKTSQEIRKKSQLFLRQRL